MVQSYKLKCNKQWTFCFRSYIIIINKQKFCFVYNLRYALIFLFLFYSHSVINTERAQVFVVAALWMQTAFLILLTLDFVEMVWLYVRCRNIQTDLFKTMLCYSIKSKQNCAMISFFYRKNKTNFIKRNKRVHSHSGLQMSVYILYRYKWRKSHECWISGREFTNMFFVLKCMKWTQRKNRWKITFGFWTR